MLKRSKAEYAKTTWRIQDLPKGGLRPAIRNAGGGVAVHLRPDTKSGGGGGGGGGVCCPLTAQYEKQGGGVI